MVVLAAQRLPLHKPICCLLKRPMLVNSCRLTALAF
jgi:hypothetical protein